MPIVERCEVCNVRLPRVQREDTRYCGSTCRVRASRARRKGRSRADLMRRFVWSRTPTDTRSWVVMWYRRLAHGPLRALAAQRREAQALRVQLIEAQATIQRQAGELAQLKEQLAALASRADRETAAALELRSERDALEAKERRAAAELHETRARFKQSAEDAEGVSLALRAERQRTSVLGNELAEVREHFAAQSRGTARLEAQLASSSEESERREAQLAVLARRLNVAARALDRTMAEVRTAKAERDTAQVRFLTLESALEKAQWLVNIKTCEAEENRDGLAVAEKRALRLRHKLAKVRALSAQRRRRVEALGKQLGNAKQAAERQQAEHAQALQEAKGRIAQQEEAIRKALEESAIAKTEAIVLQSGMNMLASMLQQEIKKSQELEAELGKARASNEALSGSLSDCSASAQRAQQALGSYKAATEKELSELRAYRQRTQDPSEELKEAKKQICQLQGSVISAQLKRDEAYRFMEIKQGSFEYRERDLLGQIGKLRAEIDRVTLERNEAWLQIPQLQNRAAAPRRK